MKGRAFFSFDENVHIFNWFSGKTTTTNPVTTSPPTTITPCAVIKCGFFARCEVINGSAGCVCSKACPEIFDPVCGSDGVTYGNTCELEKASCNQQKQITVVNKGKCGKFV